MELMGSTTSKQPSDYDRVKEVKEFDNTKSGVKGLLDSGLVRIPRIFIHSPEHLQNSISTTDISDDELQIPVIDLQGFESCRPAELLNNICKASMTWGFFQMVNHGISKSVMEKMIEGIKSFHEQPKEVKMEWYSRDPKRKVRYYCNGDLHVSKAANWRDSIACSFDDGLLDSNALPLVCR